MDEYGFEKFEHNEFPLAYLITFRTYGTWLHGDERHSVDRHDKNIYGTPKISPNENLDEMMKDNLKGDAVELTSDQRRIIESAIKDLCDERSYHLQAINVRSNHVHVVVSVAKKPERIADAFKAFATKRLREEGLIDKSVKVWSRGRSRRYLWKPRHVNLAIDYVLYGQGDVPFELEE